MEQTPIPAEDKAPIIEATVISTTTIEKPVKPVSDFKLKLRKFKASIDGMLPFFKKYWKGLLFIVLGIYMWFFTKNWIILVALTGIGLLFMANPNFKMNQNLKV